MRKEGYFILGADCEAYAKGSWWHNLFLGVHRELMDLLPGSLCPYLYTPYLYTSEL
jgi:hypothetical protein